MTKVTTDYETALALADAPRSLRYYIAALQAENDSLWSTYVALVDKLGIDTEKAKTADGKPSDVIVSYVDALRAENDRLRTERDAFRDALQKIAAARKGEGE